MSYDPFAGHASPVNGGPTAWTLASLGSADDGGGRHAPADPIGPGPGGHGPVGPGPTPTPDPSVTYGAGFGSLNHDFGAGDFQTDPGYQWRMDQGIQALDRSASARGLLFSGGELKALDRYNQGFASNEYQNAYNRFNQNQTNRFNRLASLAGIGQTSQNALTGYAANMGPNLAQGFYGIGNAQAAGAYGNAAANVNGMNGLLGGLGNAWAYYSANKGAGNVQPSSPWDYGSNPASGDWSQSGYSHQP